MVAVIIGLSLSPQIEYEISKDRSMLSLDLPSAMIGSPRFLFFRDVT